MSNIKIDEFHLLNPKKFNILKRFNFDMDIENEAEKYNIEIILCENKNICNQIKINFFGVFDIKFGSTFEVFGLLLTIEDISNHQLEGGNYFVKEEENISFSFLCNDFCCQLVSYTSD